VSRWSPETLLIALFPSRVVAAKSEGGWRPRVAGKHVVDATGTDAAATDAVAPWQPTIAALDQLLGVFAATALPATVIVSSRFVRYCIVPWRDNVVGASEQAEFARHCFRDIYGEIAAGWEIRISSGGFRRNALASAVDAAMLRAVESSLAAHGVPIASIQPHFMAACNRFRRELNGYDSGCIAVLEPGRVALGIFDKAGWRTLGTRRIGTLKPDALVPVLAQELKSVHTDALPEYLFVAAVSPTTSSFFRTRTKAWMAPAQTRIPEAVP
jgi:hypothetical protein